MAKRLMLKLATVGIVLGMTPMTIERSDASHEGIWPFNKPSWIADSICDHVERQGAFWAERAAILTLSGVLEELQFHRNVHVRDAPFHHRVEENLRYAQLERTARMVLGGDFARKRFSAAEALRMCRSDQDAIEKTIEDAREF